jgi:hypothetical protein
LIASSFFFFILDLKECSFIIFFYVENRNEKSEERGEELSRIVQFYNLTLATSMINNIAAIFLSKQQHNLYCFFFSHNSLVTHQDREIEK